MEITTRKQARARGLTFYFTGKSCKYGHTARRPVSTRGCVSCTYPRAVAYKARRRKCDAEYSAAEQRRCNNRRKYVIRNYLVSKYLTMLRNLDSRRTCRGLGIMLRKEFLDWAQNDAAFNRLWASYQLSGRDIKLAPAINRIDAQRGYVRGNIQFITHSDASRKGTMWRQYGINPITTAV